MAPRADLQWIEFTDFSAGIFSNNNLAGGVNVTSTAIDPAVNPCMAQPALTFRCRALPSGGLGPLPRMKEAFTLTTPPLPVSGSITPANTYIVNGLGTWGQAIGTTNADTDEDHRIEVHMLLSYTSTGSPTWHRASWIREHIYDTTPTTELVFSDSNQVAGNVIYQYAYFLKTRMNPAADVADPGELVMVCVYTPPSQDLFINEVMPDPATPTIASTVTLMNGGAEIFRKAVAHQGRVVVGRFAVYGRGDDTTNSANENVIYTDVNTYGTSLTEAQVYVPEIDQNISDWASMSANQMIVVKDLGGGYVLTGDLDDVTVVRLPNLMSPDGSPTVAGTQTPKGWVYSAGDRGLYIWNGGDQSEPISTQLDGGTFTANSVATNGHAGSCDRWLDLLLAPQLWVKDLEQGGWWRLDDPDAYPTPMTFFSTSKYRQQMISARQAIVDPPVNAGDDNAFYLWEYDDLAYSWSWQSHPLWLSRDQYMETREGIAALQGHGTITITLVDEDGNTDANQITVDSDNIRNYRFGTSLVAESLQVLIEADGFTLDPDTGDPTPSEAPLLHRLFLGYDTGTHLALTDTGTG